jgi:hypothetical protein
MYLTINHLLDDLREYVENPDALDKEKLALTVLFALRDIGSVAVGIPQRKEVPLLDGVATYPKDLLRLYDVAAADGAVMYEVEMLDSVHANPLEYIRLENGIQVGWRRGKVQLEYYALATDNDGLPLIDENSYEAVLARVLARTKQKQTYKNKGVTRADLQHQIYLDQQADVQIARARGNAHLPTRARTRTFAKNNRRFFK